MARTNPDPVRAYLADGETGWVVPLSGQLALIHNIPMAGPYNLGDVVEIHPPAGPGDVYQLGKVIYRQYGCRSVFTYASPAQFYQMLSVLALFDARVEDITGPAHGAAHSMAMIAHHEDLEVEKLAVLVGVEAHMTDLREEAALAPAQLVPDAGMNPYP